MLFDGAALFKEVRPALSFSLLGAVRRKSTRHNQKPERNKSDECGENHRRPFNLAS